jgi:hypothetical protein
MPGGGFREHPEYINRNGRPKKGETFTDIIQNELAKQNVTVKGDDGTAVITAKEAVVRKLINLAVAEGDLHAIKYLMDRIDGSPRQMISIGGNNTTELTDEERCALIERYEKELADIEKVRNPDRAKKAKSAKKPS